MEIKTFTDKYRNALRSIYLESRKSTFTWLETSTYQLLDFDQDTEAERIHVALEGDDVLGFISVWEPDNFIHHLYVLYPSHLKMLVSARIYWALGKALIYRPSSSTLKMSSIDHANGIGVGTQLLETAKKLSDKPLTLKCMNKNDMALKLYASKSFVIASQGADDYYVMTNRL